MAKTGRTISAIFLAEKNSGNNYAIGHKTATLQQKRNSNYDRYHNMEALNMEQITVAKKD